MSDVDILDLLILGGQMEFLKPFFKTHNSSDVRTHEGKLKTLVSFDE